MALKTSRGQRVTFLERHRARLLVAFLVVATVATASALFVVESHQSIATSTFSTSSKTSLLHVWFFSIGQGDAIFIETPTGEQILIDGGPDDEVLAKLGQVMLPMDRSIDAIFLTHPHMDHVAGLVSVLERYDVEVVYETGATAKTSAMDTFAKDTIDERAVHEEIAAGWTRSFGDVTLTAVWPSPSEARVIPEDPNEASLVLLLTYGDTELLLTGDAVAEGEEEFAALVADVDVLKVGHHGSLTSTSELLLDLVTPEIAVISVGEGNRYGHPHPAVMERLAEHQIKVFRTDQDGDILLISDGGEPVVQPSPLPF